MKKTILFMIAIVGVITSVSAETTKDNQNSEDMKKKVLFVVTSHGELGDTGKKTGYFLSEVTHPWSVIETEYDIDVVSPKGGRPPVTGFDLNDSINRKFWDNPDWQDKMSNTMTPDQVKPEEYAAIYYAGGHGVTHLILPVGIIPELAVN